MYAAGTQLLPTWLSLIVSSNSLQNVWDTVKKGEACALRSQAKSSEEGPVSVSNKKEAAAVLWNSPVANEKVF